MANTSHRMTIRATDEIYEKIRYWSEKRQCSVNEFVEDAVRHFIGFLNGDYDLPVLEIQRLNQIIDVVTVLSSNVKSLEDVTISGFDSLLGLTRGDNNYLLEEDGELD